MEKPAEAEVDAEDRPSTTEAKNGTNPKQNGGAEAEAETPPPKVLSSVLWLSTDLIREMATYLIDDADTVLKFACVSKCCHAAVLDTPQIWKATCQERWKSKWGFRERWQGAEREEAAYLHQQQQQQQQQRQQNQGPSTSASASTSTMISSPGRWWRAKYQWQEEDAKRSSITATELHSLTFDFRFWLSQFWGHGNLLASGLKWTASQNFQFAARQTFQVNPELSWSGLERGRLHGHPSGRDDLEWFLDRDGLGMQWGKLPSLWPRGTVHRLPTWGWEIRNPNVCLRAMDHRKTTNEYGQQVLELIRDDDATLWGDYLAKLRRYPTDFGMPQEGIAFMEAPAEFWEFAENRQRFPRLGIDETVLEE